MRRHRARTSRLWHRLLAREIILFRLLPRSSLARRRLALDTARIPFARPHAVRAPPSRRFHPLIRPARLRGAAAIGEIDQGIIPLPVPARARGGGVRAPRPDDRSTRPSVAGWSFTLSSPLPDATRRRCRAPRAPLRCARSRRTPRSPARRGASSAGGWNGTSPYRQARATRRRRRARVSSTFPERA